MSAGVYGLIILPDEVRPGCGVLNSPVSFCIGGSLADLTAYWNTSEAYFPPTLNPTDTPCPIDVLMGDGNCDGAVTPADVTDGLKAEIANRIVQCDGEQNTDCELDAHHRGPGPVLR